MYLLNSVNVYTVYIQCCDRNKVIFDYILFYSILFYSIIFYSILFYSILFYSILLYHLTLMQQNQLLANEQLQQSRDRMIRDNDSREVSELPALYAGQRTRVLNMLYAYPCIDFYAGPTAGNYKKKVMQV